MADKKLSARFVETVKEAGRHSDGGGLYLHVKASGGKSWAFISVVKGKRREYDLGRLLRDAIRRSRLPANREGHVRRTH